MNIRRSIYKIWVVLLVFMAQIVPAKALSFAEYAYRQVQSGRVSNLQSYLVRGYNIDAPDARGFSALCMAVRDKDYQTYQRLLQLGAKPKQDCLRRIEETKKQTVLRNEKAVSGRSVSATVPKTQVVSNADYNAAYIGAGLLAAGGIAAIALSNSGGSSSQGSSHPSKTCSEGEYLVGDICMPIVCPDGAHLEGNTCVCSTGMELVDGACQPIVCPDGTHLVGDACVLNDTCPIGTRLVGDVCEPIVCPDGMELKGNVCEPIDHVCADDKRWNGTECVPIECPDGTHLEGDECVLNDTCPTGTKLVDGVCEPIVCPDGTHLVGDACVADKECPTGTRLVDGVCEPIVCPEGTSLVGNLCVSNGDASKTHVGDDNLYGVSSDNENVFNLYSSPSYPDDEQSIILDNKGDGDVYGMYGYRGEVFNSYVVGKSNDYENKKPVGTGIIRIKDEGAGTVYGMRSHISDITQYKETINASGWNEGTAYGNINIEHTGGGASYGIFGDVRAYNTFISGGGNGYGDITIKGDGDIYGIYGYDAATNVVSYFYGNYGKGDINLFSTGDGDVYGMAISKDDIEGVGTGGSALASWFAINGYAHGGNVEANINIHNTGNGNVYGMYGGQQLHNTIDAGGKVQAAINITNLGQGNVYGMYIPDQDSSASITNLANDNVYGAINLINTGNGVVTAMRGGQGVRINNSGSININNVGNGTAVGIYGEKYAKIVNSGNINIYREAFVDETDGTTYTPENATGGKAYGIYAETGAKVVNSGVINISGAASGQGIYLENGATLENSGEVYFNGNSDSITTGGNTIDIYGDRATRSSVNINDLGGEVILNTGGKFFAESLSGDLSVSEKVALGSFGNEYNLSGALQTKNAENLNLASKSVMFTAEKKQNGQNAYDIVLKRRAFGSLLDNKDAASFWERNYQQQNGADLYNDLKLTANVSDLRKKEANYRGEDIIPGFRRENSLVYNHLSRQFNDNLFNKPDEKYIGGYKYLDISRDNDGIMQGNDGTAHTAYGMLKNTTSDGMTYGLGLTISQLKSDYDNGSERKSNIFGLWAPVGTNFGNGTQWYSKFYAGYEDGSYDRVTPLQKYSGDINSYQYGLSNEVRHSLNLGHGFSFSPTAELNLLGVYQEGFDEGESVGAINTKDKNLLSLEGGLGAYISKEFFFKDAQKFGIRIGGIYYVEFLDPDDGYNARMHGMSGRYKLSHKSDDGRAVFSARVDYTYKNLTLYGLIEQETGDYKAWSIDAGLQYNL